MRMNTATPGPLALTPSLHETIWGGRNLGDVAGKALPGQAMIGESWETENSCVVREGPFAGTALSELVGRFGQQLVGSRALAIYGRRFPLLAKFIDAQQWLSVQVHPTDEYAAAHENGKLGKTEAWYVLRAEPGAQLAYGIKRPVSAEEVRAAVSENRLEELLNTFEARPGDVIFVPAGTIHAIGAGIVLYEIQEYSDVTYRLYDYGRLQANGMPRDLHLEQALDVMRLEPPALATATALARPPEQGIIARSMLVACDYFILEEWRLAGGASRTTRETSCQILTVLEGACSLNTSETALDLVRGDTVVLPAGLGRYELNADSAHLLCTWIPERDDPLLREWREAQRR